MKPIQIKTTVLTLGVVGASLVYFFFNPSRYPFFPKCPFFTLTGFYCPGCGSQRAFHALLHGQLVQAAGFNLLAILAFPFLAYAALVYFMKHVFGIFLRQEIFYRPWFSWTVLGFVLLFWVLRNLPFVCFAWMAP